jgi:hypothetical protein
MKSGWILKRMDCGIILITPMDRWKWHLCEGSKPGLYTGGRVEYEKEPQPEL